MENGLERSKFICRQYICRYERLLKTPLTDLERVYIERRLAEEKHALRSIEVTSLRGAEKELEKVSASKTIVAVFLSNPFEFLLSRFNLVEHVGLI